MKKTDFTVVSICAIIFGLCNIVPAFLDNRWYCIFCFVLLGAPEVIMGLFTMKSSKPESLRSQSWVNVIAGLAILALSLSSYYHSNLAALNTIALIGLILSGCYGLYCSVSKHKLALVP